MEELKGTVIVGYIATLLMTMIFISRGTRTGDEDMFIFAIVCGILCFFFSLYYKKCKKPDKK